jgi:AcrR family transcriptional regulator
MSRPRTDHRARRAALADAAAAVMASQGGEQASLRAIAAALGVTTGVLTHYFPSKQALLRLAKERAFDRAFARAEAAAAGPGGRAQLLAVVEALLPVDAARRQLWRLLAGYLGDAAATAALRAAQTRRMRRWSAMYAGLVAVAQQARDVDTALDPRATGLAVAMFVEGLCLHAVTTSTPEVSRDLAPFARTHVDRLLGPRPSGRRPTSRPRSTSARPASGE